MLLFSNSEELNQVQFSLVLFYLRLASVLETDLVRKLSSKEIQLLGRCNSCFKAATSVKVR